MAAVRRPWRRRCALVMPSGFRAVAEPPSAEQLDPFHSASEELVNKVLLVRIE